MGNPIPPSRQLTEHGEKAPELIPVPVAPPKTPLQTEFPNEPRRFPLARAIAKQLNTAFWAKFGFKSVGDSVAQHAENIERKAEVIVFLTVVVLLSIGLGVTLKGCFTGSTIERLSRNLRESDNKLREGSEKYSTLEAEKNKFETLAHEDENALAPWKMLADSQFSNAPLDKRLDLMFSQVSSLTNEFGNLNLAIQAERPKFECWIGDTKVTSGASVKIPSDRTFSIGASNLSPLTAEHVTVEFSTPIPSTNISAPNWDSQPPVDFTIGGQFVLKDGCSFVLVSQRGLASSIRFISHPITISTNFTSDFLPVAIFIWSDKSELYKYTFVLDLRKDK
jgi:Leucine-rich repeat (LRR) protein